MPAHARFRSVGDPKPFDTASIICHANTHTRAAIRPASHKTLMQLLTDCPLRLCLQPPIFSPGCFLRPQGDAAYHQQMRYFLKYWLCGTGGVPVQFTPQGRAWNSNDGALGTTANAAFLSALYAQVARRVAVFQ